MSEAMAIGPRRRTNMLAVAAVVAIGSGNWAAGARANDLYAVACPTTTQCTAVGSGGEEATFNPARPTQGRHRRIDLRRNGQLAAVACPSVSQCVTVDAGGAELTFDPASPGRPTPTEVDPSSKDLPPFVPTAIACPSERQCTAVDNQGDFVTFNPLSPAHQNDQQIDPPSDDYLNPPSLNAVACPLVSRCTAVDSAGNALTFNPNSRNPNVLGPSLSGHNERGVACPGPGQCTAVGAGGESSFDPTGSVAPRGTKIDTADHLTGVACPTTSQCTAIDDGGHELTFNPTAPGAPTPAPLDAAAGLVALACPSASRCVAVGTNGEVTFNPLVPSRRTLATIEPGLDATVSDVYMYNFQRGHATLTFTLTAALAGAPIRAIDVSLAHGLSFARSHSELRAGLSATVAGQLVAATGSVRQGKLAITLPKPASAIAVTLSRQALTATKQLAGTVNDGDITAVPVAIIAISTSGTKSLIALHASAS